MNESTSQRHQRVLAMLVHFCNVDHVMCFHLRFFKLKKVKAETKIDAIYNLFTELNINVKIIVSILMDSCSVLQRLSNLFPRLVDTGGDTPQTVHNVPAKLS